MPMEDVARWAIDAEHGCSWCGRPATHLCLSGSDDSAWLYWTPHCGSKLHGIKDTMVPLYEALTLYIEEEP